MTDVASTMVEVFLFSRNERGPCYLLLKRAENVYMPGIWQGVTGRLEGTENAEEAAWREILEGDGYNAG